MKFTRPLDWMALAFLAAIVVSPALWAYSAGHARGLKASAADAESARLEAVRAADNADAARAEAQVWQKRAIEASQAAAEAASETSAVLEDLENLRQLKAAQKAAEGRTVKVTSRGGTTRPSLIRKAPTAPNPSTVAVHGIIRKCTLAAGFSEADATAMIKLAVRESSLNPKAHRTGSRFYGLFQLDYTMCAGNPWYDATWNTNRALRYIKGRYGTPKTALAHSYSSGWY